jgi:hypothetical protein
MMIVEDLILRVIVYVLTAMGFGLTIWLIKRMIIQSEDRIKNEQKKINGKVDNMLTLHMACREELPIRFASKEDTDKKIGGLFRRVDEIKDNVSFIRGKLDGSDKA